MRVVEPSIEIIDRIDGKKVLKKLEQIGRVCYKSEDKITEESAERFIASLIKRGHESVIEHESISVKVICDRGVTHEIVRHRLASYSQESTRYCNYVLDRFGNEITVVKPLFWERESKEYCLWMETMQCIEKSYFALIQNGAKPEEARSILPNSLKTEIVMTMNMREWRHFFKLRTSEFAHPQMREVAKMILCEFKKQIPVLFDDINLSQEE